MDGPAPAPVRPLSSFTIGAAVPVWPGVELVPENGLSFQIDAGVSQPLQGLDPRVYEVVEEEAREVVGAIDRWTWNGPRTEAVVAPVGLRRGAPHLLVIDGLLDASGAPIPAFAHRFRVVAADASPPDGRLVRVRGNPQPGSHTGVSVVLPEPVKHKVIHHVSALEGATPKAGTWSLDETQRVVTFAPSEPWGQAPVRVSVIAGIQDLAGNAMVEVPVGLMTPLVPVAAPRASD